MPIMKVIEGRAPVKAWTADIEESAMVQLRNLAQLPFIHKHVAVMPDVHMGFGSTVGSVIPTRDVIIPAAVGVDIGCGMMAVRTNLVAADLPDSLAAVRSAIEAAIPHGRTNNGGPGDRGAWGDIPEEVGLLWANLSADARYVRMREKHPHLVTGTTNTYRHLGSLGTGNHFIELCLDREDHVWLMLHSGSRGIGNRIGSYFIEKAKEEMERWHIALPDKDLAYLPEGSLHFQDYVEAVGWAQDYARNNRQLMMAAALRALSQALAREVLTGETAVNCHHNYVEKEHHFGANVWVTRKGAVRARKGDLGIIPGSMGARSFIVRGLGNEDSFCSCSHGAGRRMSRGEAKRRFTVADLAEQTAGVECRKDEAVVDEIPGAYKDIQQVMENQRDLVEIVAELRQVVCVKG